jgi:hypothetical protein
MKRKTSNSSLGAAINAFLATYESDKVPPGWFTCIQLAPLLRIQERQAANIAIRFLKAGQAERRMYRVKAGCYIRPVPHYRFTPQAAKALGLTKPKR